MKFLFYFLFLFESYVLGIEYYISVESKQEVLMENFPLFLAFQHSCFIQPEMSRHNPGGYGSCEGSCFNFTSGLHLNPCYSTRVPENPWGLGTSEGSARF